MGRRGEAGAAGDGGAGRGEVGKSELDGRKAREGRGWTGAGGREAGIAATVDFFRVEGRREGRVEGR